MSYNSDTLYIIIGGAYSLALFFSFLLFSYLPLVPIVPLSLGLAFRSNSPPPALLQFLFLSLCSSLGVTLFTATANALFSCVPSIPWPASLIFLLNSFYFILQPSRVPILPPYPPSPNRPGAPFCGDSSPSLQNIFPLLSRINYQFPPHPAGSTHSLFTPAAATQHPIS